MTSRALDIDRYLLAAAVVLTCALFLPAALDPVNVIKLTVLMLVAIVLTLRAAMRTVRHRLVHLPTKLAGWLVAALAAAFVVAAAVAPVTTTAILGTYGRNSGLLAYLCALVLFLAAMRLFDHPGARILVGGVVAAALFTAVYGLLQKAGLDAIPWNNPFNPIIAALGNPNFASGYLGIGASVAAGGALWRGWDPAWRALCGVTAVLCLLAAALSVSAQGPIAAAAGLFVVALGWVLNQPPTRRRRGLVALGVAAAAGVGVLLAGAVTKAGPAAAVFTDVGSRARVFYWQAALDMFQDRPLTGQGLDQYGNFWRTARPQESVTLLGGPSYSDAAHSVPLQMLAQGGLLLGLTYAAFVLLTAAALVRGLLRLSDQQRTLLAAVGAGWAAYQVQSLVSIDQVPLIVLHFTLAGGVWALAGWAGVHEVRLPGALQPVKVHPNDARAKRRAASSAPRRRELSGADVAATALASIVALLAAWQALVPLRANVAAMTAERELARGNGNAAVAAYDRALDLVPGQAFYALKKGELFNRVQQPLRARAAYEQAVRVDPFEVNAMKAAARQAETAGDLDRARTLFDRAAELDPYNDESLSAAATFGLRHSGAAPARELLEQAVVRVPRSALLWATLGDARAVLQDAAGARAAYERALELQPDQPTAVEGLEKLRQAAV